MGDRRYDVLRTVGEGGIGTVYQARLQSGGDFEKDVALKVLSPDLPDGADVARRLRDEARMLAWIRHRAVVKVEALVRLEGCWTIVMEFVDGVDLRQVLEHIGAMPESCALELVAEVAGALHVAYHAEGPDGRPLKLLHRDIKPANIQVSRAGDVKVLDFGVARADFDAREARTQSLAFGSLGYVAHERLDGVDLPAGDIFSLGVVLCELLLGERLGQLSGKRARHQAKLQATMASLGERGVSEAGRRLLGDMLAFEAEGRPSARTVERRCRQIRSTSGGGSLRDWAEEGLLSAIEASRLHVSTGPLVGRTLMESAGRHGSDESQGGRQATSRGTDVPEPSAATSGGWMRALLGMGLVLLLVVGVGLALAVVAVAGVWAGSVWF